MNRTISSALQASLYLAAGVALLSDPLVAEAQRAGQSMTVQTGVVVAAQAVDLQSGATAGGALIGGALGYATSSGRSTSRRARRTLLGAGAGGAIGNSQANTNGMQYTVELMSGGHVTVVTDQTQVRIGDCVNVENAGTGTANVRRVSQALCETARDDGVDEELVAYMTQEADRCLEAKDRMMEAETDEAFEVALRRVKFLCDD